MPDIQWYPGHMAKSKRLLEAQLRTVDAIIELCDARAPISTRNPILRNMTRGKAHVLILNKADLANDATTAQWLAHFRAKGLAVLRYNSAGGRAKEAMEAVTRAVQPAIDRMRARGANKTARVMVIGIPNVGKSTFINRLHGSGIAKASDRPGVTRSNQWVKISPYLELLDTPGMLWPKLEDQQYAQKLAFLGSVRDQILDSEELAESLLATLLAIAPEAVHARFKFKADVSAPWLEAACQGRGWLLSGGRLDTERAAALVLDEFRAGKLGKLSLETPLPPRHTEPMNVE